MRLCDGIWGSSEHYIKLLNIIESLAGCWLDLPNSFGSVHHNLIHFALKHYHAPACTRILFLKDWSTYQIPILIGVYQREPFLSSSLTLWWAPWWTPSASPYTWDILSGTNQRCNLLQCVNDTFLLVNWSAACQALLDCWGSARRHGHFGLPGALHAESSQCRTDHEPIWWLCCRALGPDSADIPWPCDNICPQLC